MIKSAQTRQWLYTITGLIAAIVPILVTTGILDPGQGDNSATLLTSLVALLGGGGALTAAHHTRIQRADGIHDPALAPIDQVTESAKQIIAQQQSANAAADQLRQVTGDLLTGVTSGIPVVGPVVAQANTLAQQALDQILPHG
jgi:isocitrate lyase